VDATLAEQTSPVISLKAETPKTTDSPGLPLGLIAGESKAGITGAAGDAEPAPAAQESPRADVSDPMDQIVLGLKGKFDSRTGTAEIRLDPPNLGAMKVSITLDNGTLTAEFQSPSSVVRDLLKGNLEKLKTVLEGQGMAVDRLAVSAPPGTGASGQNPQASFGSATHDGRSAGQHQQDARSGQQRSAGDGFARFFTQAQEAPLDLVA
jgi:flagellar hook-length control protein FliK